MWDELLWNGGLLIWHFDENQDLLRYRGYPGQSGWPGNGLHYAIAVLAADGNYDIEAGNNGGDDGDYWRAGSAPLGPGPLEAEATDAGIYPNTHSYLQGNIKQTGIVIDQISDSAPQMSFRVTGFAPPRTPSPTTPVLTSEPTRNATSRATPDPTPTPTSTSKPTSVSTAIPPSISTPIPIPTLMPNATRSPVPTSAQSSSPLITAKPALDLSFLFNLKPTEARTNTPTLVPSNKTTYPPALLPWEDTLPTSNPSGVLISNIFLRAQPSQSIGKYMLNPLASNADQVGTTWCSMTPLLLFASWVWLFNR